MKPPGFVRIGLGISLFAQLLTGSVSSGVGMNSDPEPDSPSIRAPNNSRQRTAQSVRGVPAKGGELVAQRTRTSPLSQFRPEAEIPRLAALVRAYDALPRQDYLLTTRCGDGPPVRVAVQQRGTGTHDRALVFIHGVLADHETWRHVAGALAQDYDFWLIDLPGCGDSDKPRPQKLGPGGYSPTALADRVLQALEQGLASRERAPRLTVVAHSLGGMIALRGFADPELSRRHESVLKQIDGLVLLSPSDVLINQEPAAFKAVLKLNATKMTIGGCMGAIDAALAKAERASTCHPDGLARETVDRFRRILTDGDSRRSAQAMLRQAVPWKAKEHAPDFPAMLPLEAGYRNVRVPCLIVWGKCDQTLSVAMGYKLALQLPEARLKIIANCMHSPHLEYPAECARMIRDFDREPMTRQNVPPVSASLKANLRTVHVEEVDPGEEATLAFTGSAQRSAQ
jgi:pimeloyl-ACP methyl ester carboxylesterase